MPFRLGHGTKTYLKPDGSVTIVPPGNEYEPVQDDKKVIGVRHISIHFPMEGPISADIEILAGGIPNILGAKPRWFAVDPSDGETKEIIGAQFADGSAWGKMS